MSVNRVVGEQIPIEQTLLENLDLEREISPYREHINRDLDSILSYAPEDMEKTNGKWQTTIGNFLADITLEKANTLLQKQEGKNVDICLMNFGGIRASIAKGAVTARTAYQIMPFENSLVIAELKGEQVIELVNYFITEGKPHPLSGMEIVMTSDQKSYQSIKVGGEPLRSDKSYRVATSDYLLTGGDNMIFFTKAIKVYDMHYKLRSLIIDYFKTHSVLPVVIDNRIR